jgi:hypothetical protein
MMGFMRSDGARRVPRERAQRHAESAAEPRLRERLGRDHLAATARAVEHHAARLMIHRWMPQRRYSASSASAGPGGTSHRGHRMLAILAFAVVVWMTEAIT